MGEISRPLSTILPWVGSRRRTMHLPTVDLPLPDSPTSPSTSPALIVRSTPSTACTLPPPLERGTGKCFFKPCTWSTGVVVASGVIIAGVPSSLIRWGTCQRGNTRRADPVEPVRAEASTRRIRTWPWGSVVRTHKNLADHVTPAPDPEFPEGASIRSDRAGPGEGLPPEDRWCTDVA